MAAIRPAAPARVDRERLHRAHTQLSADLAALFGRLIALETPAWTAQTDEHGTLLPATLSRIESPRTLAIQEEFQRVSTTLHALLDTWCAPP